MTEEAGDLRGGEAKGKVSKEVGGREFERSELMEGDIISTH
jgi:hypothetical protein